MGSPHVRFWGKSRGCPRLRLMPFMSTRPRYGLLRPASEIIGNRIAAAMGEAAKVYSINRSEKDIAISARIVRITSSAWRAGIAFYHFAAGPIRAIRLNSTYKPSEKSHTRSVLVATMRCSRGTHRMVSAVRSAMRGKADIRASTCSFSLWTQSGHSIGPIFDPDQRREISSPEMFA
jgi:hypothetical protein